VAFANGPEFANHDFSVTEIREYHRQLGGQYFPFTDYALRGLNHKSYAAPDAINARLRVVPNQNGGHDSLLLRLYDEFPFAEDFIAVVKDATGIFEITDDQTGAKATFSRLNDLRESYAAAVMVVAETTPNGLAAPAKTSPLKLDYWDYSRDADLGGGHTAKEFVFVEISSDTGWFQIWRGREFFN
jgi:hypothetical protein